MSAIHKTLRVRGVAVNKEEGSLPNRELYFEAIYNFRDLGGYSGADGKHMAWGRVFRSGELRHATPADRLRLSRDIGLNSILDLRNQKDLSLFGTGSIGVSDFHYVNLPLITDPDNSLITLEQATKLSDLAELYLLMLRVPFYGTRIVQSLRIVADFDNLPLVFHCSAGKDRTGLLAAILLSALGVDEQDIVADYATTAFYMERHLNRISQDPQEAEFLASLPSYIHESTPSSMEALLASIRREYGSTRNYLTLHGADGALFEQLETALLV
jgi:protein-tyrosine phosphatase